MRLPALRASVDSRDFRMEPATAATNSSSTASAATATSNGLQKQRSSRRRVKYDSFALFYGMHLPVRSSAGPGAAVGAFMFLYLMALLYKA